jgi:hypothetical protein
MIINLQYVIVYNDVTKEFCTKFNLSFRDYSMWLISSKEGTKLLKIVQKSLQQIRDGKKPTIDYECHPELT